MILSYVQIKSRFSRERIIVPIDRHFVVYPGDAGVDEGAGLDKGDLFYTGHHQLGVG